MKQLILITGMLLAMTVKLVAQEKKVSKLKASKHKTLSYKKKIINSRL
ncbi:MAG: hypothetical protein M0D53_14810 [Flavobacterium sp. JAD_PAG50586_2]|nr:MAG: hypothetical protein M0D53_14810 [Flavobacterium sp. JAD_PAG50586_2]